MLIFIIGTSRDGLRKPHHAWLTLVNRRGDRFDTEPRPAEMASCRTDRPGQARDRRRNHRPGVSAKAEHQSGSRRRRDIHRTQRPNDDPLFACVVLDRDILTCPVDEIRDIQVLKTWLDGKPIYARL